MSPQWAHNEPTAVPNGVFTYLILGPWAHVGSFGPSLGSFSYFSLIWTQFGLILGKSAWFSDLGPNLGSLWAHYGLIWAHFWSFHEPIMSPRQIQPVGSFWAHFLSPRCAHYGSIMSPWAHLGPWWAHLGLIALYCYFALIGYLRLNYTNYL